MKHTKPPYKFYLLTAISAIVFPLSASAILGVEVTGNGGFEAGDVSEWAYFPTGSSTFNAITLNPSSGTYAGELINTTEASAAVIKQPNLAIGLINPGETFSISFDARGSGTIGGILFAELFSEIDGGGISSSVILGSGPVVFNANPEVWTSYNFVGTAGPDVSGGITLQFVRWHYPAVCCCYGCRRELIDNCLCG
jgi:hypothetical protein